MLLDPNSAPKVFDSPVQRSLRPLGSFFSSGPQPAVSTEHARSCGELIGRHSLNLIEACGQLNLSGLHSAAVSLYRPLEDALDCLGAVTLIAGDAERWQCGHLRPSDAAKLWHERLKRQNAATGELMPDYRKQMRSLFNNLAHCSPEAVFWDVFRQPHPFDANLFRFRINHSRRIIESNAHRIDAYLIAHCLELLEVVQSGYAPILRSQSGLQNEISRLESEIAEILKEHARAGSLDSLTLPHEMEVELQKLSPDGKEILLIAGNWVGRWDCGNTSIEKGALRIEQQGEFLHGWLKTSAQHDAQRFEITEELSGIVSERRVLLDGISDKIEPETQEYTFSLDSFELVLSDDSNVLFGSHSCLLGAGPAVFRKSV
jgi:hypothetical protein